MGIYKRFTFNWAIWEYDINKYNKTRANNLQQNMWYIVIER